MYTHFKKWNSYYNLMSQGMHPPTGVHQDRFWHSVTTWASSSYLSVPPFPPLQFVNHSWIHLVGLCMKMKWIEVKPWELSLRFTQYLLNKFSTIWWMICKEVSTFQGAEYLSILHSQIYFCEDLPHCAHPTGPKRQCWVHTRDSLSPCLGSCLHPAQCGHSERPALQMRSPPSDPGSGVLGWKTRNEARCCAFFQDGRTCVPVLQGKSNLGLRVLITLGSHLLKLQRLWNREMSSESNDKADMIHESVRRKETGNGGAGCRGRDIITLASCPGPGKMQLAPPRGFWDTEDRSYLVAWPTPKGNEVLSTRASKGWKVGMWAPSPRTARRNEGSNKTLQSKHQWKNTSSKQTLKSTMCFYCAWDFFLKRVLET